MFSIHWDRALNNEIIEMLKNNSAKAIDSINQLEAKRKSKEIGFMDLPSRQKECKRIKEVASWISSNARDLIVLGIGGSSLGGKTIISSLSNKFSQKGVRVTFADNIDPDYFSDLINSLDLSSTVFNVISKSGSTAETMAQFLFVYGLLSKKLGKDEAISRIIFTTDPKRGALSELAKSMGFKTLEVPQNVGGRFSVLSDVGLLPAAANGIDTESLLRGAKDVVKDGFIKDINENPVLKYSFIKFLYYQKGYKNSVMMPYSTKLSDFSAWYVQLWAESLGKDGLGQTPIPATGATDQHSQLQLFMDGPKDKFITFIGIEKTQNLVELPKFDIEVESFDYLSGHSMFELIRSEMFSTERALYENNVPSIRIELPQLDAYSLGALFMFFEMSVAITGELLGIDAFNQPGVELSKNYTYQMMGRKGY